MTQRPERPFFSRPPDDDEKLDAWVNDFANTLIGTEEDATAEGSPPDS